MTRYKLKDRNYEASPKARERQQRYRKSLRSKAAISKARRLQRLQKKGFVGFRVHKLT